jgi:predicted anti-sigma-YlaC factor YlaD
VTCSVCEAHHAPYLEGEASPDDVRAVEQHLRDCAACRELASAMRTVELRLAGLPGIEPRTEFTSSVMMAIAALPAPKPSRVRARWFIGYLGAAWAALIVLTATHVIDWQRLFTGIAVEFGKAGAAAATLADVGARLHLPAVAAVAFGIEAIVLVVGVLMLRRYAQRLSGWIAGAQTI